jgi:hypothetical protein
MVDGEVHGQDGTASEETAAQTPSFEEAEEAQGAQVMLFIIVAIVVILLIVYGVRSKSVKEGTWLGVSGAKAAYIWNHASVEQRSLMLAAISITESTYRDTLLQLKWMGLPPMVQSSLANTLQDIREGKET